MSEASTIDRIEQMRCDLLRGLMKRDHREWRRRQSAAERTIDASEVIQSRNSGPARYVSDGGLDDYFSCGRRVA
jgi:hypothetical protein